jgi:hypothetical protein
MIRALSVLFGVLGFVAASMLPGCAASPKPVVVLGDSLLMQSWQEVYAGVTSSGTRSADMKSMPGSGLADPDFFDWSAQLRWMDAATHPDQVVVELGTNDVGHPDFYESGAAVDLIMSATHARRIVWVLPSASPLLPARLTAMRRIRAELIAAAQTGPFAQRLDVIDADAGVASHAGALLPDSIHLTPLGCGLLGGLIRDALDASP